MNRKTVLSLNDINQDFYRLRAEEFSATRQGPWQGWVQVRELVERHSTSSTTISVLDVGCGNGRFARFLKEHYSRSFSYLGVDASARALDKARAQLAGIVPTTLLRHDVVAAEKAQILPPQARRPFSLIVVFGLLHHVPGQDRRQALLAELAGHYPASVRTCVLLRKDRPDLPDRMSANFVGFDVPDEFVVGYGLDYDHRYRNLPDICVLTCHAGRPADRPVEGSS